MASPRRPRAPAIAMARSQPAPEAARAPTRATARVLAPGRRPTYHSRAGGRESRSRGAGKSGLERSTLATGAGGTLLRMIPVPAVIGTAAPWLSTAIMGREADSAVDGLRQGRPPKRQGILGVRDRRRAPSS